MWWSLFLSLSSSNFCYLNRELIFITTVNTYMNINFTDIYLYYKFSRVTISNFSHFYCSIKYDETPTCRRHRLVECDWWEKLFPRNSTLSDDFTFKFFRENSLSRTCYFQRSETTIARTCLVIEHCITYNYIFLKEIHLPMICSWCSLNLSASCRALRGISLNFVGDRTQKFAQPKRHRCLVNVICAISLASK